MADDVFASTTTVGANERSDFWRTATRPIFDASLLAEGGEDEPAGSAPLRPVGALRIGLASFARQDHVYGHGGLLQSGLDHYLVKVLTSGALTGDFNGVDVAAEAGDICILDMTQTIGSRAGAGSRLAVAIPRRELEKAVGPRNLHGVVLRAGWSITRLIVVYLAGLYALGSQLPETQASAAQETAVMLLAAALSDPEPGGTRAYSPPTAALRRRVLEFIDQNLNAPELSADLIRRRFKISRAHLYRAFAADGGVAAVLRDRRLDAAFLELTRASNPIRSIAEIAHGLGFSSGNQLLRSFRARFGMTPSQAREGLFPLHDGQKNPDLQSQFMETRNRTFKP